MARVRRPALLSRGEGSVCAKYAGRVLDRPGFLFDARGDGALGRGALGSTQALLRTLVEYCFGFELTDTTNRLAYAPRTPWTRGGGSRCYRTPRQYAFPGHPHSSLSPGIRQVGLVGHR